MFPDFDKTLAAEKVLGKERQRKMPASMFTSIPVIVFFLFETNFIYILFICTIFSGKYK